MDIIAYHADCPDGFCSAFTAQKRWPNATLLPVTHGQPPPFDTCRHKDVLVVDFSWKHDQCVTLEGACGSLTILDHHKTAQAELAGLSFASFDMNRSGATLTWDTLFPGVERPWYVEYVEDRDLWRFALPESKIVNAFVMALPHEITHWAALDHMTVDDAFDRGQGVRMQVDHYVEKVVAQRQMGTFEQYSVMVVNAAYPNISDVGDALCEFADIGLGWFERGDGLIQFSLRSRASDVDVSIIAVQFGGGGHLHAAGFQLPNHAGRDLIDLILGRTIR